MLEKCAECNQLGGHLPVCSRAGGAARPAGPVIQFLGAIGVMSLLLPFAFSIWAEWGPYAWSAAAQMAVLNSYGQKLTFLLTIFIFVIPITAIAVRANFVTVPRLLLVAFGLPALCVAAHLAATIYFLVTGGESINSPTFDGAIRSSSFLPRKIVLQAQELPALDFKHESGITTGSSSSVSDIYIPFVADVWPNAGTPVVLKCKNYWLEGLIRNKPIEGTVRRAPLPYLVRRSWTENDSTFAIIVDVGETVRDYWLVPAIAYGVCLVLGVWTFISSSSKGKS